MACQSCRLHARLLARNLRPVLADTTTAPASSLAAARPAPRPATTAPRRRHFGHTAARPAADENKKLPEDTGLPPGAAAALSQQIIGGAIRGALPRGIGGQYLLTHQLDTLYKVCAAPAAYSISEDLRKAEEVPKTADGEELGEPHGPWLESTSCLSSLLSQTL